MKMKQPPSLVLGYSPPLIIEDLPFEPAFHQHSAPELGVCELLVVQGVFRFWDQYWVFVAIPSVTVSKVRRLKGVL